MAVKVRVKHRKVVAKLAIFAITLVALHVITDVAVPIFVHDPADNYDASYRRTTHHMMPDSSAGGHSTQQQQQQQSKQ